MRKLSLDLNTFSDKLSANIYFICKFFFSVICVMRRSVFHFFFFFLPFPFLPFFGLLFFSWSLKRLNTSLSLTRSGISTSNTWVASFSRQSVSVVNPTRSYRNGENLPSPERMLCLKSYFPRRVFLTQQNIMALRTSSSSLNWLSPSQIFLSVLATEVPWSTLITPSLPSMLPVRLMSSSAERV